MAAENADLRARVDRAVGSFLSMQAQMRELEIASRKEVRSATQNRQLREKMDVNEQALFSRLRKLETVENSVARIERSMEKMMDTFDAPVPTSMAFSMP